MNKLPTGTVLVLPGCDLVAGFLERMEEFAAKPNRTAFSDALAHKATSAGQYQGINRISVAELIVAMYCDLLNDSSAWSQFVGYENLADKQWRRMVKDYGNVVDRRVEQSLYKEVIEDLYEEIHDWVVTFDGGGLSWHVWYVRRLGLDIIVEKGEDYRILDWTRRLQRGADHLKAHEEGEALPADAWLPDAEGRRFAELLREQQNRPSALGKSAIDTYDNEKRKSRLRKPVSRRRYGSNGTL